MTYRPFLLRPAAWVAPVLLALAGAASGADLTIRGPILEVDPDAQKITVRQPDLTPLELRVTEESEILLDGKTAKLTELAKGQKAVVQYRKNLIAKIEVKTEEAAAADKTDKPAAPELATTPPPADKKDSQEKDSEKKESTSPAPARAGQGLVYLPIVGPVYLKPYRRPVPRPVPVPPPPVRVVVPRR